jgi:hypothetical protein
MTDTPNEIIEPVAVAETKLSYYQRNRERILAKEKEQRQRVITDPDELERRRLQLNAKHARFVAKNREKVNEYQRVKQLEYYHKKRKAAAAQEV